MKCIHCDSDTNYKDRVANGGQCAACRHRFAFEPKTDPLGVSDGLFQRVLKDVSADNTVFFTERQLWYELNRRKARRRFWVAPWGWVAGLSIPLIPLGIGVIGVVVGAIGSNVARKKVPIYATIPRGEFQVKYLAKWIDAHGPIEKLLASPAPDAPSSAPPAEVAAYSFDRALVTEDADIAAMLVANNFHFENNCAILSRDGYPFGNADTVLTMLRRNPQLAVFALHDASVEGCLLAHSLRDERWFPDTSVRIFDLGLRPHHARRMLLSRRSESIPCPPVLGQTLAPDEIRWLEEGSVAELATLRPARLMRAVYQGFARANQSGADGVYIDSGGGIWIYSSGPGYDTGSSTGGATDVAAADSFG